jgi:hypothetical protein
MPERNRLLRAALIVFGATMYIGTPMVSTAQTTVEIAVNELTREVRLDFTGLPHPYVQISFDGVDSQGELYWVNQIDNDNPKCGSFAGGFEVGGGALDVNFEGPVAPAGNFCVWHWDPPYQLHGYEEVVWILVSKADETEVFLEPALRPVLGIGPPPPEVPSMGPVAMVTVCAVLLGLGLKAVSPPKC